MLPRQSDLAGLKAKDEEIRSLRAKNAILTSLLNVNEPQNLKAIHEEIAALEKDCQEQDQLMMQFRKEAPATRSAPAEQPGIVNKKTV